MSPISEYDLGRAHGRIKIDYDGKGTKQAQEDLGALEEQVNGVIDALASLLDFFRQVGSDFGEVSTRMSRDFGILAGASAVLLGMTAATGKLTGALLQLRGGMNILRAFSITMGGVPDSIQGFPKVLKQIVMLSSAITLFVGSTKLLDTVVRQIGNFAGSTKIVQALAAKFPVLGTAISNLLGFLPSIRSIGRTIDGWASPIHKIAKMTLAVGTLITVFRTGTKVALGLTKAIMKLGTASTVIVGLIQLAGLLASAMTELSGVVGLLPGAFAVTRIAAGTLMLGLQGFGDAMKNLDDPKKFEEAIKKLAPAARETALEVKELAKSWDNVRRNAQQSLFSGIAGELRRTADVLLPMLNMGFMNVAEGLNQIGKEALGFFRIPRVVEDLNFLFMATRQVLNNLTEATKPFLQALLDITVVSADVFADLTEGAGEAARDFAFFIRTARESGDLRQWILDGVDAFGHLIGVITNVGQIFETIFKAFGVGGDNVLQTLNYMLSDFDEFIEYGEGAVVLQGIAETMKTLSQVARDVLGAALLELGPILVSLLPFLKEMAQTIGTVLVAAIKIVGPMLQGIAQALSWMAPVLGPIVGFFLGFAIAGKVLTSGLMLLIGVLKLLVTGITAVIWIVKALTKVMMANPWLALIAAIIALTILIVNNWDKIKEFLQKAWEWIKKKAEEIWGAITDFFKGIWQDISDFFSGIWEAISDKAVEVWNSIAEFFAGIWDSVSSAFEDAWNAVSDFLSNIWNKIVEETRFIWEPLIDIFKSIFSIIGDLIYIAVGAIVIAIRNFWNAAVQITKDLWNGIVEFLTMLWEGFLIRFHAFWDPIATFFVDLWNTVSTATTEAWNAIAEFFSALWATLTEQFHAIWDPISQFFSDLWNTISQTASSAWNAITTYLSNKWDEITNSIKEFLAPIGSFFANAWNEIKNAVSVGTDAVLDFIGNIPGWILDLLGNLGSLLWDAGKAIIMGFLEGLKSAFQAVADWVSGIADWIAANKGPLPYDFKLLQPAGQAIMDGLIYGLQSKKSALQDALRGITSDIANGIDTANSKVVAAANTLSTSANVGIASTLALAANSPATPDPIVQAVARASSEGGSASGAKTVIIESLTIPVAGNLDPTKPAEWKQTIRRIKDEIRDIERESA